MAQPTTMVLKVVDLQCCKRRKKVKKLLCKFPEIRDQVYDEKQNTVRIKVVSCCPERLMQKIRCKGCKAITSIEIEKPPPDKPEGKGQEKGPGKDKEEESKVKKSEPVKEKEKETPPPAPCYPPCYLIYPTPCYPPCYPYYPIHCCPPCYPNYPFRVRCCDCWGPCHCRGLLL